MKYLFTLVILLAGCERLPPMSNDEIIRQVKICHDGGMDYTVISNISNHDVYAIHCIRPLN